MEFHGNSDSKACCTEAPVTNGVHDGKAQDKSGVVEEETESTANSTGSQDGVEDSTRPAHTRNTSDAASFANRGDASHEDYSSYTKENTAILVIQKTKPDENFPNMHPSTPDGERRLLTLDEKKKLMTPEEYRYEEHRLFGSCFT